MDTAPIDAAGTIAPGPAGIAAPETAGPAAPEATDLVAAAPEPAAPEPAAPFFGEPELRRVVGLADLCELLAATFAFPASKELAGALADGAYLSDAAGCLTDAGLPSGQVQDACRSLETFVGRNVCTLAQSLRRGHSLLFLSPGSHGPIWPCEGAFRFAATGTDQAPSLFRSPMTLQVEKAMNEAGLLPSTARTEPVDSIWGELGFLSQLYGRQAQALALALGLRDGAAAPASNGAVDTLSAASRWSNRAAAFTREHVAAWMPDFMERVCSRVAAEDLPYGAEYAVLAQFGSQALQVIAAV